jgi:hypothetical protein
VNFDCRHSTPAIDKITTLENMWAWVSCKELNKNYHVNEKKSWEWLRNFLSLI